jgi:hypothetical protein
LPREEIVECAVLLERFHHIGLDHLVVVSEERENGSSKDGEFTGGYLNPRGMPILVTKAVSWEIFLVIENLKLDWWTSRARRYKKMKSFKVNI